MNPHDAKVVDPIGALLPRVQAYVDAHPDASPRALKLAFHMAAEALGMKVTTPGTIALRAGSPLVWDVDIKNWELDIRPWLKREHGVEIGVRK